MALAYTRKQPSEKKIVDERAYKDAEKAALAAYKSSINAGMPVITNRLRELLSVGVTAHVAGVSTRTVSRWAEHEGEIHPQNEQRIRLAYELADLLGKYNPPKVIRAWFLGTNPILDDASPADAIHDGNLKGVRAAAYEFIVGG